MIITFDRSFSKWIGKVKNQKVKEITIEFISQVENAKSIEDLSSIKKLKGSKNAYRKRIGDYRIGFEYQKGKVHFVIIGHRKDIYNILTTVSGLPTARPSGQPHLKFSIK